MTLTAKIQQLEDRLAAEDFNKYKQEHPGTQKTPSDPMFHPAYGEVKPHLPHEQLAKLSPREHARLAKEHEAHVQNASKASHEARRSKNPEQSKQSQDLMFKHQNMANMHHMYALSRTGKPDLQQQAGERAKQYHQELSA